MLSRGCVLATTERTLYIENFGADDDHDSLRKRLAKFGKVGAVATWGLRENSQAWRC